jgi:hypothetical protein
MFAENSNFSMPTKIRRIDMLREYDIKSDPQGRQVTFSIRFIKINGESVFLPRAIATGLNLNVAVNRMRGVRPVNSHLDSIGHIYPVRIDNIVEWNVKQVTL